MSTFIYKIVSQFRTEIVSFHQSNCFIGHHPIQHVPRKWWATGIWTFTTGMENIIIVIVLTCYNTVTNHGLLSYGSLKYCTWFVPCITPGRKSSEWNGFSPIIVAKPHTYEPVSKRTSKWPGKSVANIEHVSFACSSQLDMQYIIVTSWHDGL